MKMSDLFAGLALIVSIGAFYISFRREGAHRREEQRDRLLSALTDQLVKHREFVGRLGYLVALIDANPCVKHRADGPSGVREMLRSAKKAVSELEEMHAAEKKKRFRVGSAQLRLFRHEVELLSTSLPEIERTMPALETEVKDEILLRAGAIIPAVFPPVA